LAGGESGAVIEPGQPDRSLLWEYVRDGLMPPKHPLPAAEQQILRDWIAAGAKWGTDPIDRYRVTTERRAGYDWWALQPIERPPLPAVKTTGWVRTPIDAFVLARLESAGLDPSPPADRRMLARRLSFDLVGLPPVPDEMAALLSDESAGADDRLVGRLLGSPQYGERWARHWLDVVRYGESQGFERDKLRTTSWPYRDWVIGAFNADVSYDQFARLQLAGDVLAPDDAWAAAATGFLVAGAYDEVGQQQQSAAMRLVVRQDELEDIVGTVGQTFLGLTVHCARCHDHKFDPVRQREYYQLTAALGGVRHGERPFPTLETRQALARLEARRADVQKAIERLEGPAPDEPLAGREQLAAELERTDAQIRELRDRRVYAVVPKPPETAHVLVRGNPAQKAEIVAARGLEAIASLPADFGLEADAPEAERRRRLAAWIASRHNPLFARVIVNRLWQFHFGVGIVETPNDFGFNGGRPSHPELLDWLAAELVDNGWSLKHLQRRIVSSATYRQASLRREAPAAVDAGNRLLWRRTPQRLEAEALRDAVLSVSGQLNPALGGPPFEDFRTFTRNAQFYEMIDPIGFEFQRRTIYRTWVRSGRSRLLDAFDCPDPSTTAPRRAVTTTPLQSLALLNNSFILRMSDHFAERLRQEAGQDPAAQVARAWELAYFRRPDPDEQRLSVEFIGEHGLPALCRVVFNSSEFLYVD
ncbi:MAG TPA: PSD1 and planctomycete cytochrome C domain-containing protein, partial [Planctomycetaceae bacterium]|nr:PSD1 and planctomycete cytochrome C domain-containing protein [Planctomycetaceae bacterium]